MGPLSRRKNQERVAAVSSSSTLPPLLEPLEPRLLLSADLYLGSASVDGFSGVPGSSCTLQLEDIGNFDNSYVFGFQADITWYLSPDTDPYGTYYELWSGNLSYDLPAFSSGGTWSAIGVVPSAPPGQYYAVAFINSDGIPAEINYANNYLVLSPPLTVVTLDDHGDSALTATTVSVGDTVAGNIEGPLDTDWFRIYAEAGHAYEVTVSAGTLQDPYVEIYDTNGSTLLLADDDSGPGYGSRVLAVAPATGYYFIAVSPSFLGIDPDLTGSYTLRTTEVLPLGTVAGQGRVLYNAPDGSQRPLRSIVVSLWDKNVGDDELLGWTYTDNDGRFLIETDESGQAIPNLDMEDYGRRDLYVMISSETDVVGISEDWLSTVLGLVWGVQSYTINNVDDGITNFGDLVGTTTFEVEGATILDSIKTAHDWLHDRTGWTRDYMLVHWPNGSWPHWMSYSWQDQFGIDVIKFPENFATAFADPQSVVVHEYGHAIHYAACNGQIPVGPGPTGNQAPPGGGHWAWSQSSPSFAFAEGWAEFFQCAVFNDPRMQGLDLETNEYWKGADGLDGLNDDGNTGETVEGAVASIFWDIFDEDNDDGIDQEFDKLWSVFLGDDPVSIWDPDGNGDFYHYWISRYGPSDALDDVFLAHGIPVSGANELEVSLGDGQAKSVTYTDTDGTSVTVSLKGGMADVRFVGDDLQQLPDKKGVTVAGANVVLVDIVVTAGGDRTSLTFKTKGGDGLATVDEITSSTALGKLFGKTVDLVGSGISLSGTGYIGSIQLHDIKNGADIIMAGTGATKGVTLKLGTLYPGSDIVLGSPLKSLSATQWIGSSLTTPWASNISIKGDRRNGIAGDFGADLTFTGADPKKGVALRKLSVAGTITDSVITAKSGSVGTIMAAQWDSGSLDALWAKNIMTKGDRRDPSITGDFGAALNLTGQDSRGISLNKLQVAGKIVNSQITLAGAAGTIMAAQWDSGSLDALWAKNIMTKGNRRDPSITGNFGAALNLTGQDKRGMSLNKLQVAGKILDSQITLSGAAGTIMAAQWDSGSLDALWAKNIMTKGNRRDPAITGDFGASLTLTGQDSRGMSLNKLQVAGTARNSTVWTAGSMGTLMLGATEGSDFLAGIAETAGRHASGEADFVNPLAVISSAKIKGRKVPKGQVSPRFFVDSNFSVASLGAVSLLNVDYSNDDESFGLFALNQGTGKEIKSISARDTVTGERWKWPFVPVGDEIDFEIRVI